ncbi:LuxR C-terminal-related transcriptional regulator [Pontiella agarivorans]|uniref:LuxR C-terminal-related transcriptional regulator n=1 Tax=Pontiella agarivorans TaxID=3038953 RepID=UPI003D6753C0
MGYVKKEVADKLNLSYRTITTYAENIYKKLQVPNIAAAVATALYVVILLPSFSNMVFQQTIGPFIICNLL